MPNLTELDMTNNEFYDHITNSMLNKFGDTSFSGNEGLCGAKPFMENNPPSEPPVQTVPSNPSSFPETSVIGRPGSQPHKWLSPGAIVAIVIANCVALLVVTSFVVAHWCARGRGSNSNSLMGSGEVGKRKSESTGAGLDVKRDPTTLCSEHRLLGKSTMYPKVKARQEQHQHQEDEYDEGDVRDLGLKAFLSLSLHSSTSPVKDHQKVVSMPSIVKVPKCYVPQVPIPRVPITEDFEDCSLSPDSPGSAGSEKNGDTDENEVNIRANVNPRVSLTEDFGDCSLTSDSSGPEKDGNTDENKVNIRAGPIPRPRAVISSPDNDTLIGSRNKIGNGKLSASKNSTVLQNRHARCKVKSHDTTDIPSDARKCKEPVSKDKIDPAGKRKVHKGNIKSENLHRHWKF